MKRREAIRNVILVSVSGAILYSCRETAAPDAELLAELTETIIPKTDFIGAKDLLTGDFVLMMSKDCLPAEAQQKFTSGMKAFNDAGFVKMAPAERKAFIDKLDGDAKDFFEIVKQGTIVNFTTSQEYLAKVKNVTSLIPSKFQACVTVNS